jgi:hypothetical protein
MDGDQAARRAAAARLATHAMRVGGGPSNKPRGLGGRGLGGLRGIAAGAAARPRGAVAMFGVGVARDIVRIGVRVGASIGALATREVHATDATDAGASAGAGRGARSCALRCGLAGAGLAALQETSTSH